MAKRADLGEQLRIYEANLNVAAFRALYKIRLRQLGAIV